MTPALPPLIPDNAPFSPAQRAWLNGFFAGLLNLDQWAAGAAQGRAAAAGMLLEGVGAAATALGNGAQPTAPPEDDGDYPWHDPALPIAERLNLAEGKPLARRLMAAMGQLDCGQCGYDCKTYAEAIAAKSEGKLTRCVPGGRETRKMLESLIKEAEALAGGPPAAVTPAAATNEHATAASSGPGRDLPAIARLRAAEPLTAAGSAKDVRHVVIDLADSGLAYDPGDSLGLWADNDKGLVDAVIDTLGAAAESEVGDGNGHSRTLVRALTAERCLRQPTTDLLKLLAAHAGDAAEAAELARLAIDDDLAANDDVLDLLTRFPSARPPAKALVEALDPLQPRLYSIASSQRAHPSEVHLTVGVQRADVAGRVRHGVGSTFLAERLPKGETLRVWVQKAHGFALPADDAVPIIMVGPGTGIAPFRAFLEERVARGATGDAWLFFGNPHRSDFLYETELERFRERGALSRLDVAFSREGPSKVYVQDLMREQGLELWQWLQNGAHFYVCGDAKRMASDVEKALIDILVSHGGLDPASAKQRLKELAKAGRYQRDVY